MNTLGKVTLLSLAIGFGSTAVAGPNGGLADRINEARSYPNKTVETETPVGKEYQMGMESMWEMHAKGDYNGSMTQEYCMKMMRGHVKQSHVR